jgi:hypothetical protein
LVIRRTNEKYPGKLQIEINSKYEEIAKQVHHSNETKHVDETGWKRWGKRTFVWIMSTASGAVYKIQEERGAEDTTIPK